MEPTYITKWQDTTGAWRDSADWHGSERQNGDDLYAAMEFASVVNREGRPAEIFECRYETCR